MVLYILETSLQSAPVDLRNFTEDVFLKNFIGTSYFSFQYKKYSCRSLKITGCCRRRQLGINGWPLHPDPNPNLLVPFLPCPKNPNITQCWDKALGATFFPHSCLVSVITEEGEDGRLEVATGAGVGEEGADEGEDREEKEMESAKDTAEGEGSTSGSTTRSWRHDMPLGHCSNNNHQRAVIIWCKYSTNSLIAVDVLFHVLDDEFNQSEWQKRSPRGRKWNRTVLKCCMLIVGDSVVNLWQTERAWTHNLDIGFRWISGYF